MPDMPAAYLPDVARWLICAAPVVALFALIAFCKMSVPKAASAGLALAIGTSLACGAIADGQILDGLASGAASAVSILYAVWPAMILYDILRQSGAFDVLRRFAASLTRDRLALVLLFGWVFSSFLQSITGFGVPVAVCAPFLTALGIRPVPAVVMTLLGHSWGNTYGTLAMAFDALLQMGGMGAGGAAGGGQTADAASVALLASALLWVVNLCGGVLAALIYGGRRGLAHGLPLIALLSSVMGGGQMLVSQFDTTIACFIPTAAALVICLAAFKAGAYAKPWDCPSRVVDTQAAKATESQMTRAEANAREVALAASPFIMLAVLSLALFAVPAVRKAVSDIAVCGVAIVGHAGFVLTLTCLFAMGIMTKAGRLSSEGRSEAIASALARLRGVSVGIALLVIMASILQHTGQMDVLAAGVAAAAGGLYVPLAPALGTFGAFVTSSNMSSNILLAGFQSSMASNLDVSASLLLAAQTAGGAAGAAIGPSTILLGAATVGAHGQEGRMLKPLLAASFGQAALLGAIVWGLAAAA